jgi:hypothetical protein
MKTSVLTHGLHCSASTEDVPLFPSSRPHKMEAISIQLHASLIIVSKLYLNQPQSELLYDWRFTAS